MYGGGKCELIREGAFDDIDLSVVHHTGDEDVLVGSGTGNGFVSKIIRYKGKAAHAAGAPHLGVNALNAATLGLSALAFQRETFQDKDSVRVHPIITKGGNLVNVVPDEVVIETLVRAANIDAIVDADEKTSRAFTAGAYADTGSARTRSQHCRDTCQIWRKKQIRRSLPQQRQRQRELPTKSQRRIRGCIPADLPMLVT